MMYTTASSWNLDLIEALTDWLWVDGDSKGLLEKLNGCCSEYKLLIDPFVVAQELSERFHWESWILCACRPSVGMGSSWMVGWIDRLNQPVASSQKPWIFLSSRIGCSSSLRLWLNFEQHSLWIAIRDEIFRFSLCRWMRQRYVADQADRLGGEFTTLVSGYRIVELRWWWGSKE